MTARTTTWRHRLARLREDDDGMSTAEYAIGTIAARTTASTAMRLPTANAASTVTEPASGSDVRTCSSAPAARSR